LIFLAGKFLDSNSRLMASKKEQALWFVQQDDTWVPYTPEESAKIERGWMVCLIVVMS
jgi:hypothetical protein